MTTPLQPGVFVDVTQTPLAQSVTSIPGEGQAAFAAAYNMGPTSPVMLTSWPQFVKYFGNFSQSNGALLHQSVYQFFANGGSSCFCVRVANTDATTADLVCVDIKTGSPDNIMTIKANTPGAWGDTVYIALTTTGQTARFNMLVYVGGTNSSNLVETFPSLSVNPADSRNIASVVNSPYAGSQYVNVTVTMPTGGYVQGTTDPAMISATALAGGADGSTAPTLGTAVPAAYDKLQDQILYVNLPGITDTTTVNDLLTWADGRGDVMVIIDGPAPTAGETSAACAQAYVNMVTGAGVITSDSNAVVYAPWLNVLDPSSSSVGAMRYVPPGGAVLGIWAKGLTLYGVQQAPAGTWATLNVQGLEVNFTATDLQNLNAAQVNAIKKVPNTGICVFGARTLGLGLPSRYVSVQRTLIQLSHDMENLLQFATFQPNGPVLWEAITNVLTAYLTEAMQDGVLAGSTPATSFVVTCDDTVNTPTTAQGGVVNVTVGVALTSPAEFIMINLQQLSASASS
jgi:hypothetical protein